jgi:hypothetical protein
LALKKGIGYGKVPTLADIMDLWAVQAADNAQAADFELGDDLLQRPSRATDAVKAHVGDVVRMILGLMHSVRLMDIDTIFPPA